MITALTILVNVVFGEMTSVREMIEQNMVVAAISFRLRVQALAAAAEVVL